jgi:hypothetical protein
MIPVAYVYLLQASYPKSCTAKNSDGTGSWQTIWEWLVWDMQNLFDNKYQPRGPSGEVLEFNRGKIIDDNYFVWVYAVLGDMDFFQKDLGLPSQSNMDPNWACAHCHANKTNHNWFDFRPSAAWRKSAAREPATTHVICKLPGFTTWHFAIDWLHVMDLGLACHAVGGTLYDVVFRRLQHLSRVKAMAEVASYIQSHTASHGKLPLNIELKHFINVEKHQAMYPVLQFLKAAEVRALVPVVANLALEFCDGTPQSKHICKMMKYLACTYDIMHECGDVLGARYSDFDKAMTSCLLEYNWLARDAMNAVPYIPRWSVVPKMHYAVHLSQQAGICNPRLVWCYGGEDFVGRISKLGLAVSHGTAAFRMPCSLMDRYRIGMHIRLMSTD